jgi:hydroxymethylbilane synthase
MSLSKLVVGSRGSKLALFQANWVKSSLELQYPDLAVEIKVIKTSGDIFTEAPLSQIGGKGLFTKEIEEALFRHDIDLAVHSLKDLPTVLPEGLCLAAVSQREDVRDAFLSNRYEAFSELPLGAQVGTSSLRRQSQLLHVRDDVQVKNLRGNLETRIRKLKEGHYDAIILACAGLIRLGYADQIRERISVDLVCPAVGQGALGIEARCDDPLTLEKVQSLNHSDTRRAVEAERAFLRRLGGGCQVPIAGFARIENRELRMLGVIASPDGKKIYRYSAGSDSKDPEGLGVQLAESLLAMGAQEILQGYPEC